MPNRIIHSSSLSQSQISDVNNIEIISNYIVLSSLILDNSPDSAVVLAEPVKNLESDRINWFSNLEGEVVPLKSVDPDKLALALANLDDFNNFIQKLSQKCLSADNLKIKKNGQLLARLLQYPEAREYYFVGEKVVVVGWGLKTLVSLPILDNQLSESLKADPPPIVAGEAPPPKKVKAPKEPKAKPPKIVYEPFNWRSFAKKTFFGALVGLVLALALIYVLDRRVFTAVKILAVTPKLNGQLFDENENYLAETRQVVTKLKDDFKNQKSNCLIFSQKDVLANNFSYLDGCWETKTSFLNAFDGQKTTFGFCYQKNSQKANLKASPFGSTPCQAEAEVTYRAAFLTLKASEELACDDEGAFPQFEIKCAPSPDGSSAKCDLTQAGDLTAVFPVEFLKRPND